MATPTEPTRNPDLIAITHLAGDQWRCLLARRTPRGPQIQDTTTFPGSDAPAARAWATATGAETLIGILPSSEVICKTVSLPDVDGAMALQALELQAEGMESPTLPPHRQAVLAIAPAQGHQYRVGLVMGWPTTSPWRPLDGHEELPLVSDVAAMTALLGSTRPNQPLAWIDPSTQSVALAMTTPGGVAIRATREAATTTKTAAAQLITEMGLAGNHTQAYIEDAVTEVATAVAATGAGDPVLVIPSETAAAIDAATSYTPDQAWWNLWGVPLGAAIIACTPNAAAATVTTESPIEVPTFLGSIAQRLSAPVVARRLAIAAVLAIVLGPLIASGARLGLLSIMNPDLDTQVAELRRVEAQQVIYRHLEQQSWSMTKMLGDIAAATPEGVELFRIDLTPASNRIRLSGEAIKHEDASAREVIGKMQELIAVAGIFGHDIQPNIEQREYVKRAFTINASASRPHLRSPYAVEQDFSRWTLADRRAGIDPPESGTSISQDDRDALEPIPGGTVTLPAATLGDDAVASSSSPDPADAGNREPTMAEQAASRRDTRTTLGPGGDLGSHAAGDRGGGSQSAIIPAPQTDAEIAMMTPAQLRDSLAEIAAALQRRDVKEDEELKKRLNAQMREIFDVLREKEG